MSAIAVFMAMHLQAGSVARRFRPLDDRPVIIRFANRIQTA
jgi:hypothetical protein